jgi:hypothetical protein
MPSHVVHASVLFALVLGGPNACRRDPASGTSLESTATVDSAAVPPRQRVAVDAALAGEATPPATGTNSRYHEEFCRPERYEGFASEFPCTFDSECVPCDCRPVNRAEHARLGGDAWCERFNQPPASQECIATNPACCDGRCVLAR